MKSYGRYLRIGWTAFCGLLCVLLIVLWVWSHWFSFFGYIPVPFCGSWLFETQANGLKIETDGGGVSWWRINPPTDIIEVTGYRSYLGFVAFLFGGGYIIKIPYWFPVSLSATLASLPWMRPSVRFSLRTLLIATMLVAVVLGLAAYAANSG
jgi:hypothetical protein